MGPQAPTIGCLDKSRPLLETARSAGEPINHGCLAGSSIMFNQALAPVGGSLVLSVLVAALPIVTVLVALGVLRRPAWQASLAGLVVALVMATGVWEFPIGLALDSVAAGSVFALWPVMWIVINGLLLYNI